MIIAIDGPAGSGKTTVGRLVAEKRGSALVDTGLYYRAVTVEARRLGIGAEEVESLVRMVGSMNIRLNTDPTSRQAQVWIDQRDISNEAVDPDIAGQLAKISQVPQVRRLLVQRQRDSAGRNAVVLGRDIGTVIFPEADFKFFFTAPAAERAARRRKELDKVRGSATPDAVLEQEIDARDRADSERETAPLRAAPDAIIVATEGKSVRQVFDEVMRRLPKH
ncbi:MAG TPA: (d)CMP kinase [Candidatus Dormibacteraeota bacterium]